SLDLLGLSSNRISDLSPLSNLMSLRTVFLEDNRISDLSPLSGLTSLEYLQLDANRISNLSPLSGLTSLECLYLNLNQIGDISPISSLAGLWRLGLSVNQISNLSPLSGLTGLKDLDLSFNQISDIEPLVSNPGMADADIVSLSNNPLNSSSINACIPALEGRGVIVNWATLTRAPWVTTADASSIATNSARLNGELRWLGTASSVTAYFAWGTTSGGPYANKTTGQEMTSTGAFYFDLEGLHPGVTYYYQARATGDGDSFSTDESSFTTG
ncbi:MAG TPA: leucine-rich repeat domain-containing protein, partial [Dehalococcoidia bacterium]|nr:leucine-rich repeat domain-containing protein [Dehalococcoidia bacterium]